MSVPLDDRAREFIDGRNAATVATVTKDGGPQTSVILVGRDGDVLLFSTTTTRAKARNIAREPRISVLIYAGSDSSKYVEIRGTATMEPDPEKKLLREMYAKYLGTEPPPEPGVERLIVRLTPEKVHHFPPR